MVRYYLAKHDETEKKRALLVLFLPFRNEMAEIHEAPGKTIDQLFDRHKDEIENMRRRFEPNRELLINIEKAMDELDGVDNDPDPDDMLCDEPNDEEPSENTDELDHFIRASRGPPIENESICKHRVAVCQMIRKLNQDQRKIFDDVMERL